MATKHAEDRIRAYLDSLTARPAKAGRVVDKEVVKALTQQIRDEADPVNKLRLYAAREEARKGNEPAAEDTSALEADFVAEAKAWADSEGIPVDAFLAMKVPGDVLKRAGFRIDSNVPAASRWGRASSTRHARVPIADVERAISQLGRTWTVKQLAELIDRDAPTARNYVTKLIGAGKVQEVGDAPKEAGQRGRAPRLYAKA